MNKRVGLDYMTSAIAARKMKLVLENRPRFYKFGVDNYGEIPGFINPADNDPWDVIVAGYPRLPVNVKFPIKKLKGVFMLPNGNHKLIVDVECGSRYNHNKFKKELKRYEKNYNKFTKMDGCTVLF